METLATRQQPYAGYYNNAPRSVSKPKMEEKKPFRLAPMTVEDTDRVINFLRVNFFLDEPLNVAVGLLDEPGSVCDELENYCRESIKEGVSLLALSPSDELLGVSICGVMRRDDNDKDEEEAANECQNKKFVRILRLLMRVGSESDVFGQVPDVDRILEVRVVSVSEKARGQGIAKAFFFDGAKAVAKEKGIPLIKTDCTSHFSGIIADKLGYECIYSLNYADFIDEHGEPYLVPPEPHRTCRTCILRVN